MMDMWCFCPITFTTAVVVDENFAVASNHIVLLESGMDSSFAVEDAGHLSGSDKNCGQLMQFVFVSRATKLDQLTAMGRHEEMPQMFHI